MTLFAKAQKTTNKFNTVKLKAGHVLYADDRTVIAKNDTVIQLPISVDFYITTVKNENINEIYQGLQEKVYKNRWIQQIHNIIILRSRNTKNGDTIQTEKSEVPFLKYHNLIVRKIVLQELDVFGPTIYDTIQKAKTWIGQTGNNLHIKTRSTVIYNHLLFKAGDRIDPYTFADNERILRQLPYIEDAKIKIINSSIRNDSVDVIVITKDTWSIGFDFTTADFKNLYLDVWDNNILGSGQEINNLAFRNPGKLPYAGLSGYYVLPNINGSFINCKIGYNAFGSEGINVDVSRDFYTQSTKYAGDLFFEKLSTYTLIQNDQNMYSYVPVDGSRTNMWIGRSFPIHPFGSRITSKTDVIITAGLFNNFYSTRPTVTSETRYPFQDKTYYLVSLALSNQGFYRSNLVYNYGRTEDIPYGLLVKYTYGYENNEFFKRFYHGLTISKGNYIGNLGYINFNVDLGAFIRRTYVEQGILRLNSGYFTNLLVLGEFKLRHFVNINFTKGYSRLRDEFLYINDLSGIRGYVNDSAKGTQRLSLNLESVCFTPLYLAGFRFAVFAFADFAYIGKTTNSIFSNPLYTGFGFGVRIKNPPVDHQPGPMGVFLSSGSFVEATQGKNAVDVNVVVG